MKKIFLILSVIIFIIIIVLLIQFRKIYTSTLYFENGSVRVIVLANGFLYEDKEIEEPYHKTKYKFVKRLTKDELREILEKNNEDEINSYIRKIIYNNSSRL